MNGHADRITVTLHKDGASATVADNGRGIPVDRHAQYKKARPSSSILTTLHAGGKFEAKNYYHSGGLHGVGASGGHRARGEKLVARVRRDGAEWEQTFSRGKPASALKKVGPARGSGTSIFFRPDPKIFPDVRFDPKAHRRAARGEGPTCTAGSRSSSTTSTRHEGGLPLRGRAARVPEQAGRRGRAKPAGREVFTIQKEQDGLHLDCALAWTRRPRSASSPT